MREILAVNDWPTNAELIADVAELYLDPSWSYLDLTYGRGAFWEIWRPDDLTTNDLWVAGADHRQDFRQTDFLDRSFDVVVFDPPYKLSGTPALGDFDVRYGIDFPASPPERMRSILDGLAEALRIAKKFVLAKCQDQVVSGRIRWQTYEMISLATTERKWRPKDRFDMIGGGRPQPEGRRQLHARGRGSTLLVFERMSS